jgi:diaminopimelate epimerase
MELFRMSAAGNVFYLTLAEPPEEADRPALARQICAGLGVQGRPGSPAPGADGLIFGRNAPPRQSMYNPDGSQGFCANGLRCLARLLADAGTLASGESILTSDGPKAVFFREGDVELAMGPPRDLPGRPGSMRESFAVSIAQGSFAGFGVYVGNPHFVLFTDRATQARAGELGPALERHTAFPEGVNVEFAVQEADEILVRVWERGAGETLSCGTGAAAVAAAGPNGLAHGQERRLRYPGGVLRVRRLEDGGLCLAGPVLHEGRFRWEASVRAPQRLV